MPEAATQEPEPAGDETHDPPPEQQQPDSTPSPAVTQAEIERRILESIVPTDTSAFVDPRG